MGPPDMCGISLSTDAVRWAVGEYQLTGAAHLCGHELGGHKNLSCGPKSKPRYVVR